MSVDVNGWSIEPVAVPLVVGHLYLALVHPATRHSLRGITLGTVRRDWARRHHADWDPDA